MATATPPLAAIPFRLLLSYYLIAPAVLAFIVVDQAFLGGHWQHILPPSPYVFFWYAVVFNLPHIICSSVMLLSGEYLAHYRKPLMGVTLGALFLTFGAGLFTAKSGLPFIHGFMGSIFIFAVLTLYHVFMQQLGLNKLFAKNGHWAFNVIAWSNILPGAGAYVLMFTIGMPQAFKYHPLIHSLSVEAAGICLAIAAPCYVFCWYRSQTTAGRVYLLANALMSLTALTAIVYQYWLFAIVVPRVVHDLTAFTIYINHDTNRFKAKGPQSHPLYGPLARLGVPLFIITPLVAMGLAYPITHGYLPLGWWFIFTISLIHYGTESFVWKHGTPHRTYISFAGIK